MTYFFSRGGDQLTLQCGFFGYSPKLAPQPHNGTGMSRSQTDTPCAKTGIWNNSVLISTFVIPLCYSFWGNRVFTLYDPVLCPAPLKSMPAELAVIRLRPSRQLQHFWESGAQE